MSAYVDPECDRPHDGAAATELRIKFEFGRLQSFIRALEGEVNDDEPETGHAPVPEKEA